MFQCSATPEYQTQGAWLQTTSFSLCGSPPFLFRLFPSPRKFGEGVERLSLLLPPPRQAFQLSPPPPSSKSESSKWHHEQFALPQPPVPVLVLRERVLSQRGEFIAIYLGVTVYHRMIWRGHLVG